MRPCSFDGAILTAAQVNNGSELDVQFRQNMDIMHLSNLTATAAWL